MVHIESLLGISRRAFGCLDRSPRELKASRKQDALSINREAILLTIKVRAYLLSVWKERIGVRC
jgi:hypothetical protein